jgi:hypothetical protein
MRQISRWAQYRRRKVAARGLIRSKRGRPKKHANAAARAKAWRLAHGQVRGRKPGRPRLEPFAELGL